MDTGNSKKIEEKINNYDKALTSDKQVREYIDVLSDAALQRDPTSFEKAQKKANVIHEITGILRKYDVTDVNEIVNILVSVIAMPIQLTEPDIHKRTRLMSELSTAFLTELLDIQSKDVTMHASGSELSREIDKLRNMGAKFFRFNK